MDCKSGALDWDDFERNVNSRTKLVAVGAASNALGTINDVQRAARLARTVGALTFVDAVHYIPHHLADVCAMECDFLVCSAYKFYGPHVGAMWCRRELLESLPFPKLQPAPDWAPERAETGTLSHEGIAGAAAAVKFLASLAGTHSPAILAGSKSPERDGDAGSRPKMGRLYRGTLRQSLSIAMAALDERSRVLMERMWTGLAAIDGVTLYGPPIGAPRTSIVAFTVRGVPSSEVARLLADRGVFVSHGNFYAATVIERLGLGREGLVRAGCACYTTADEVERLVDGVRGMS
jgi:selenocysteine lyase/cysteine desulfurase